MTGRRGGRGERWREEENEEQDVARVDGCSYLLPPNEFLSESDCGGLTLMPRVQKQARMLFIIGLTCINATLTQTGVGALRVTWRPLLRELKKRGKRWKGGREDLQYSTVGRVKNMRKK